MPKYDLLHTFHDLGDKTSIGQKKYFLRKTNVRKTLESMLILIDIQPKKNNLSQTKDEEAIEMILKILAYLPKDKAEIARHGECRQIILVEDNQFALVSCENQWYKVPLEKI